MRLKINLKPRDTKKICVNYNYPLSAAIYKFLRFGSKEFADFLHEKGFNMMGRKYKLFSFALNLKDISLNEDFIFLNTSYAELIISSPLVDDFIKNFVMGSLKNKYLELHSNHIHSVFEIKSMEVMPEPQFTADMKMRLLTPLVISTVKDEGEKQIQYFLRYNDNMENFNRIFNNNLCNKYKLINNRDYEGESLKLIWDEDYINNRLKRNVKLTKKITVEKENMRPVPIIGNLIPFRLQGNPELIRTGYYCGFGEKNSMGMGLAEIVWKN